MCTNGAQLHDSVHFKNSVNSQCSLYTITDYFLLVYLHTYF